MSFRKGLEELGESLTFTLNLSVGIQRSGSKKPSLKLCEAGSLYGILVMLRGGISLRVRANVAQSTAKVALDRMQEFFITFLCTTLITIL